MHADTKTGLTFTAIAAHFTFKKGSYVSDHSYHK